MTARDIEEALKIVKKWLKSAEMRRKDEAAREAKIVLDVIKGLSGR